MLAAQHNQDVEVISVLLNAGADVNGSDGEGFTAIMIAPANQNSEVVQGL